MNSDQGGIVRFGPFELNIHERILTRNAEDIRLGSRALDILISLIERAGEVVSRHELMKLVWRGVVVEEANLRTQLSILRRALADGEGGNRYIVNVAGQGYCFVAPLIRMARVAIPLPVASSRPGTRHELPAPLETLIGREETVTSVRQRLKERRFVSIVGAGGIGKSSVAVAVADQMRQEYGEDHVFFVDLSSVAEEADVPSAIASSLGCAVQGPNAEPAILAFVASKNCLVVLDSCEHLIVAVAQIADRIHAYAPMVYVLATSREALRADGETIFLLGPLEVPPEGNLSRQEVVRFPAVQLFLERASASGHDSELTDDEVLKVSDMCRRLDGIALAVELVASRVGTFGIGGTAELLANGAELHLRGRRSALPRHQTLQAMLDWSINLLSDVERTMLFRLSVFAGPFSVEAAHGVAAEDGWTVGQTSLVITSLVEKSLIFVSPIGGYLFYRLLDTTRSYAGSKLASREDVNVISHRHANYFRHFLKSLSVESAIHDARTMSSFIPHLGNIRKALAWCFSDSGDALIAVDLSASAAVLLMDLSQYGECQRWCSRALAIIEPNAKGTPLDLRLSEALARSAMYTLGNRDETKFLIETALNLAERLGDNRRQLNLLTDLNIFFTRRGDAGAAVDAANRAAVIAQKIGVVEDEIAAELMLGVACHQAGDQAGALRHCRHGFKLAAQAAPIQLDLLTEARGRFMLARSLWLVGYPDQSLQVARQTIREISRYSHHVSYCVALTYSIPVFCWCGNFDEASAAVEILLAQADKYSLQAFKTLGAALNGQIMVETGRSEQGIVLLRASLEALKAENYNIVSSSVSCFLAKGLADLGRFAEAQTIAEEAHRLAGAIGEIVWLPDIYRTRAEILLAQPDPDLVQAEAFLVLSMEESVRQSANSWELRSAISLARLWRCMGRESNAKELLGRVYAKFKEGFDTSDLVAARQILSKNGPVQ
ncbi:ATP-binding protein [Rhizobium sp. 768_B6_N1_8]|uniref:ATP-binding protein n=1 Tax=unclassified Rhizobium TaxID=2613769 RepID=UPI003F208A85